MIRAPIVVAIALAASPALGQTSVAIAWIDVHMHPVARSTSEADFAVRQTLAAMDEAGVSRAVLLPTPQGPNDRNMWDYSAIRDAVRNHPQRLAFLAGGGTLNPLIHQTPWDRPIPAGVRERFTTLAERALADGAIGFGEITAHHLSLTPDHPYESTPADHPLLLLLADIAARHGVPIDFHFDPIAEDIALPPGLTRPNPPAIRANLAAFERLLAHNREARVVWAHAGSDIIGHWTVELSRALLARHRNLFMSLRPGPGRVPANYPLSQNGELKPEWSRLLHDFTDRFVIGTDQFVMGNPRASGPGAVFAQKAQGNRQRAQAFLAKLPPDIAQKIASDNARAIYKLAEVSR